MGRSPKSFLGNLICVFAVASLTSCGPASKSGLETHQSVDFKYEISGSSHRLSELRGRPLIVVFMRTSELPSHVYIREVKSAYQRMAGRLRFLVLTVEISEKPFLELFTESEELPFPIGVAERSVALGQTVLGRLPLIPVTYLLNSAGVVQHTIPGAVRADVLRDQIDTYLHQ